ncbi:MAG TPA: asparagine synthase-related protein [Solirubrobacterales bacterium]
MTVGQPLTAPAIPQLEPLEVSSGMVFGRRRTPSGEVDREPGGDPRSVLERILLEALRRPPCIVAFSGGRDSSAILAEAVRVARAHGLEDPVPCTLRFGDAPRTAEEEWQELVIGHLRLGSWSRREVTDELDALGPIATDVLRRHGVHWPPNIHTFGLMFEVAAGGSLVTGNGGDELFSPWAGHRVALLRRGRALPRRADLRPLARALLPASLLARLSARRGRLRLPWLTPAATDRLSRTYATSLAGIERSWAEALEDYLDSRYLELGLAITGAMARDAGVALVEPFFDSRYVRSVGADAPPEGYASRGAAMARHFGDLLPPRVVGRATKAVFTEVFSGPETRRFAAEWDGSGVDLSLVDPEALREAWLAPVPDLRSLVPLQAAWLASRP